MFWDTSNLWFDDERTKKIKELRRRSNYYEQKYDDLDSYVKSVDRLLSKVIDTYGIWSKSYTCQSDNVLEYKYDDAKSDVYTDTDKIVKKYEPKRNTLKTQRDEAYRLYRYYYNKAMREDY